MPPKRTGENKMKILNLKEKKNRRNGGRTEREREEVKTEE